MHSSAGGKNDKHKLVLEITLPISGAAAVFASGLCRHRDKNMQEVANLETKYRGAEQ
jgi:hypothetical protein